MKLTWFGGMAFRAYAGGAIVVLCPEEAPETVDRGELLAGAETIIARGDRSIPALDPASWRPAAPTRLVDADEMPSLQIGRVAGGHLLVAAPGEPPLLVLGDGELPESGRWLDGAMIVITTARTALAEDVASITATARPRLFALALDEAALDAAMAAVPPHLGGAGLVSLEPGLALEL